MEQKMRKKKNYFIGIVLLLFLFVTSILGTIFIMGPAIPLIVLRPDLFRRYNDFVIPLWLALPGAIFEVFRGSKVTVYGSKQQSDEPCLIIMNHRCRLDWMFYWMVLLRYGSLEHEKILMRNDLKLIPGAGWAMQNVLYLFIRRRWEEDQVYMNQVLDYYIDLKYPLQMLLYPEGTNWGLGGLEKSDAFAKKNGLPLYKYCLHPRVRGFNFIVQKLRDSCIKSIVDVTIAYPQGICHGEKDLLRGYYPEEVLVRIDRYSIDDIPEDSTELDQWCVDRWKEKEERLRQIYEENKAPIENSEMTAADNQQANTRAHRIYILILLFWAVFFPLSCWLLYQFYWMRWCFIAVAIFYTVQQYFGGMDLLQLKLHKPTRKCNTSKHS